MTLNSGKIFRFASTLTLTFAAMYTVCALTFVMAPDLAYSFYQAWFHGLGITSNNILSAIPMSMEGYLLGLVCLSLLTFIGGCFFEFFSQLVKPFERIEDESSNRKIRHAKT